MVSCTSAQQQQQQQQPEAIEEGQSSEMAATATVDASHHAATTSKQAPQEPLATSLDARFSCNICFDAVTEPVVTRCGHLYCWPCLYRWLSPGLTHRERASLGMRPSARPVDESKRVCPVCKSDCSLQTVVPIYVRSSNNDDAAERPSRSKFHSSRRASPAAAAAQTEQRQEAPPAVADDLSEDGNMGLDIDGDDDGGYEVLDAMIPRTITTSTPMPASSDGNMNNTGLRQRRRTPAETREDDLDTTTSSAIVPTRPLPNNSTTTTSAETTLSNRGRGTSPASRGSSERPTPNHMARATLSYGLVLAMHQTLLHATSHDPSGSSNSYNNPSASEQEGVPSLHYPHQRRDLQTTANVSVELDQDPASTVFLSRLLLGLSLFVLVCLLSF